jgi:hypothetical protein
MKAISLHVDDIEIGGRHRPLSNEAVQRLSVSMKDIGLRHPISVRVVDEMEIDGKLTSGVPVLVAGYHRLEAAKQLGWSHIDCIEVDDDNLQAELWELAENLHRLDLTKEQRDEHIRRYAELLEAKSKIQVAQNAAPEIGYKKPPPQTKAIPRQIAEETGLSVDTVRRALKPQAEVIPISARSEHDVILAQANAIIAAWNRACPEAREIAMDTIEGPVFDSTKAGNQ